MLLHHFGSGCRDDFFLSRILTHADIVVVAVSHGLYHRRRRFAGILVRVSGQVVPGERRPSAPGYFPVGPSLHQVLSNGWLEEAR